MYAAINAWTFAAGTTADEWLRAAAAAGFAGVELVVSEDGPLRPDSPLVEFERLRARAKELRLQLAGLATGFFWQFNYASPEKVDRVRAADLTLALLDRAAAAGIGAILVVPAVVGRAAEPRGRVSYADAEHRSEEALAALRFEAEARGVTIAIENVWNRFLLSPVEAADFIDRVNSPCVGWYFDVGNVLAYGYPDDWIATLAGRIARVHVKDYDLSKPGPAGFCALGAGSVDWPGVVNALRAVGYDGPLTYEGGGDPYTLCRQMNNIVAGRPPGAGEVPP